MSEEMKTPRTMNKAQQKSLYQLFQRQLNSDNGPTFLKYRDMRRNTHFATCDDCVMIQLWGMWIGIERDGYRHT
jgi:hypothetical protein